MTRAASRLLHGDLEGALRQNALALAVVPALAAAAATGGRLPAARRRRRLP
jgi:hypothetical protein